MENAFGRERIAAACFEQAKGERRGNGRSCEARPQFSWPKVAAKCQLGGWQELATDVARNDNRIERFSHFRAGRLQARLGQQASRICFMLGEWVASTR